MEQLEESLTVDYQIVLFISVNDVLSYLVTWEKQFQV